MQNNKLSTIIKYMDRPICKECGIKPVSSKGKKNGVQLWHTKCSACKWANRSPETIAKDKERQRQYMAKRKETKYGYTRKPYCEYCGFRALHPTQLSTDHIDGNNDNNDPDNLWTLCHNCHHLKTFLCQDWNGVENGFTLAEIQAMLDDLVDPPVTPVVDNMTLAYLITSVPKKLSQEA